METQAIMNLFVCRVFKNGAKPFFILIVIFEYSVS